MFDMEFEKEINKWANVNVEGSEREDGGSNELQGKFTSDEVRECVAKLKTERQWGQTKL